MTQSSTQLRSTVGWQSGRPLRLEARVQRGWALGTLVTASEFSLGAVSAEVER